MLKKIMIKIINISFTLIYCININFNIVLHYLTTSIGYSSSLSSGATTVCTINLCLFFSDGSKSYGCKHTVIKRFTIFNYKRTDVSVCK